MRTQPVVTTLPSGRARQPRARRRSGHSGETPEEVFRAALPPDEHLHETSGGHTRQEVAALLAGADEHHERAAS